MKAISLLPQPYQLALRRDPDFLLELARIHGDALHVRFGPRQMLLLHDPAAIGEVLIGNQSQFVKGRAHERARDWLGDGVLLSEGAQHLHDRRLLQPAFQPLEVQHHAPAIVKHALNRRARWQDGTTRDIAHDMHELALTIVGEVVCGVDVGHLVEPLNAALTTLSAWFSARTRPFSGLRDLLPLARHRATRQTRAWLDDTIAQIIAMRRRLPTNGCDLLTRLLHSDHPAVNDTWLRDQILTLLLAGRETVAAALAWTWYVLALHPVTEARLHAEIDVVLAGRPPAADNLPQLHYTRMVFAEALRLYPPAWATNRRALAACHVGGHNLPAGAVVLMSQYVLHRSPHAYDDPLNFRPERWEANDTAMHRSQTYLPFGAGPRRCIGEPLAWLEGILILATLAQQWRLRLQPRATVIPRGGTSLQPLGGLPMIIERR